MKRPFHLAVAVVALLAVTAATVSAGPATELGGEVEGCVTGTPDAAAAELVDAHATVVEVAEVAGLGVAKAVDWRVTPGFQNALLDIAGRWCTVDHFNAAAARHLAGRGAAAVASAFAAVAGMQYLGDVAVRDVAVSGPVVTLTTMGGRHGAVSVWRITVDGLGVSSATFTTTGWVPGFADASAGGLEGITSLPGHTRTFLRATDGRVVIDATVEDLFARAARERAAGVARAAAIVGNGPGDDLAHTFEDGFTIKVSYGLSPYTPDTGMDTGVAHADRLRNIHRGVIGKYNDFLRWGVRNPFGNRGRTLAGQDTGLPEQAGYINVDSPVAPACLACAFLADAMEVHIALLFPEIAPLVVPISYPDSEAFMVGVIGHEMVHGLQGGYSDARGSGFTNAFIEGTARASESLHDDAHNSFQPGAIHYNDSGNGCEGFENGRGGWIQAQANGPFNGHTYDACYFWWTYFAAHGPEGLTALLQGMIEALDSSPGTSAAARNLRLLDVASEDAEGALDIARWGAAAAAGNDADGYTIPAGQTGDAFNWFSLLSQTDRATALAATQSVSVANGGFRAYRVGSAGTITELPEGAVAYVFDVVERQLVPARAQVGSAVAPGQILVLVAPAASSVSGTLTVG